MKIVNLRKERSVHQHGLVGQRCHESHTLAFQPYLEGGFPHGHDQWISNAKAEEERAVLT